MPVGEDFFLFCGFLSLSLLYLLFCNRAKAAVVAAGLSSWERNGECEIQYDRMRDRRSGVNLSHALVMFVLSLTKQLWVVVECVRNCMCSSLHREEGFLPE